MKKIKKVTEDEFEIAYEMMMYEDPGELTEEQTDWLMRVDWELRSGGDDDESDE